MAEIIPRPLDKAVESLNGNLSNKQDKILKKTFSSATTSAGGNYATDISANDYYVVGIHSANASTILLPYKNASNMITVHALNNNMEVLESTSIPFVLYYAAQ